MWLGGETGDLLDEVTVPEPLEHSVVGVPDGVGSSSEDIVTVLEPIENSVVEMPNALGKDSGEVVTVSEPIEHSFLVRGSHDVGDSLVDGVTVSDPIEHSGVRETADPPSVSQLMLNSDISRDWEDGRQGRMCDDNTPPDIQTEDRHNSGCCWLGGSLVPDRMG